MAAAAQTPVEAFAEAFAETFVEGIAEASAGNSWALMAPYFAEVASQV